MSPGSFEALSDLDGKRRVKFGVPGSTRGRSQPWEDFFEGSSTIFIIGVVEEGDVMDAPVPHESADDGGEFAVTTIPLTLVVARNVVGFWGDVLGKSRSSLPFEMRQCELWNHRIPRKSNEEGEAESFSGVRHRV